MKIARFFASGRVQGVFYRQSTKEKAEELGLSGWVRNLSDGRVEVVAQGDEMNILRLIEWAKNGPKWANVDRIEVQWENLLESTAVFTIKH